MFSNDTGLDPSSGQLAFVKARVRVSGCSSSASIPARDEREGLVPDTALPGALNHGTVTGTRTAGQAPKKGPKASS